MSTTPTKIVFFDLETTFSRNILQFGAAVVDVATMSVTNYIELDIGGFETAMSVTDQSVKVNGITKDHALTQPLFKEYAEYIRAILDGAVWAGYNIVSFDIPVLNDEFARAGVKPPEPRGVIDVYLQIRADYARFNNRRRPENLKLSTLAEFYGLASEEHSALDDSVLCFEVLERHLVGNGLAHIPTINIVTKHPTIDCNAGVSFDVMKYSTDTCTLSETSPIHICDNTAGAEIITDVLAADQWSTILESDEQMIRSIVTSHNALAKWYPSPLPAAIDNFFHHETRRRSHNSGPVVLIPCSPAWFRALFTASIARVFLIELVTKVTPNTQQFQAPTEMIVPRAPRLARFGSSSPFVKRERPSNASDAPSTSAAASSSSSSSSSSSLSSLPAALQGRPPMSSLDGVTVITVKSSVSDKQKLVAEIMEWLGGNGSPPLYTCDGCRVIVDFTYTNAKNIKARHTVATPLYTSSKTAPKFSAYDIKAGTQKFFFIKNINEIHNVEIV